MFDQHSYSIRCEWGAAGVERLAPVSDVVVIVDVLSFSTSVDIAVGRGALVFPCPWSSGSVADYAASVGAQPPGRFKLSPGSLLDIPSEHRLVLPSPNGSALSFQAQSHAVVIAGCLRNARAVAAKVRALGNSVALIPAGERWPDGSLRPCVEDLLGVGAIVHELQEFGGKPSSEARLAGNAFDIQSFRVLLDDCLSAQEKRERHQTQDVALAGELNVSTNVPMLRDGAYRPFAE